MRCAYRETIRVVGVAPHGPVVGAADSADDAGIPMRSYRSDRAVLDEIQRIATDATAEPGTASSYWGRLYQIRNLCERRCREESEDGRGDRGPAVPTVGRETEQPTSRRDPSTSCPTCHGDGQTGMHHDGTPIPCQNCDPDEDPDWADEHDTYQTPEEWGELPGSEAQ